MSVNMYSTLPMHKRSERKDEQSDVGAFATFVNMKYSYVRVVVNVV